MRIAVDGTSIGPGPSGARTRLLNLYVAYAGLSARHEIVVYLAPGTGLDAPLLGAGIECVEVSKPPSPLGRALRAGAIWRERLEKEGADIFQAETLPIPSALGRPVLLTLHDVRDLAESGTHFGIRRLYARYLLPRDLRRVERVITVSRHTRDEVIVQLRGDREKIVVVPNAADGRVVRVEDERSLARFRRRHGIPWRFILALGHLEKRKNLGVVIAALGELRRHDSVGDVGLVLAGRDEFGEGDGLRLHAERESVPLIVTGPLDDHDRNCALSAACCLAMPSLSEGFGIVPLEAMSTGCPVVAATSGAIPEVVADGALLVECGDRRGWTLALSRVLSDPSTAEDLVDSGRRRVRAYGWTRSAELLRDLHDELGGTGDWRS